jgi:hypothetical protein
MLQLNWQGFYVLSYLCPTKKGLYGTRRYMFPAWMDVDLAVGKQILFKQAPNFRRSFR